MTQENAITGFYNDIPIRNTGEDKLNINKRIVKNILNFLTDIKGNPLTIAITGEWGIGKTSVMNLLEDSLEEENIDKNLIIHFDPLLEGKLEVREIMESFYLKLYTAIPKKRKELLSIIKNSLFTIDAIALSGGKLKEKWDQILEIWEKNDIKSFSTQTKELNKYLGKEKFRIFVFIDEIDRLFPAQYIVNFLMFAKILESFDNLICFVGIDYTSVIKSLTTSPTLGLKNYERAKNYLDKIFQARFDVNHSLDTLTSFTYGRLTEIDKSIFQPILALRDYTVSDKLKEIIGYLKTPRQIKKWLITISMHKYLLQFHTKDLMHSNNIIKFLMLSAICVKHPIILDDFESKTLRLLSDKNPNQQEILDSVRIREGNQKNCISDPTAYGFLKEVLDKKIPKTFLPLFIRSYGDKEQIEVYRNYFENKINNALQWLIESNDEEQKMFILSDLKYALVNQYNYPTAAADIEHVNNFSKIHLTNIPFSFYSENPEIILATLSKIDIDIILKEASLELLVFYVDIIEKSLSISRSVYSFQNRVLDEIGIAGSQERTSYWLRESVLRIEETIGSTEKLDKTIEEHTKESVGLILIFECFIRWSKKEKLTNKSKFLTEKILSYFRSNNISQKNKIILAVLIFKACVPFPIESSSPSENPLIILFDGNIKLIEELKKLKTKLWQPEEIGYYEEFEKRVTELKSVNLVD
jgi:hypothetical protein